MITDLNVSLFFLRISPPMQAVDSHPEKTLIRARFRQNFTLGGRYKADQGSFRPFGLSLNAP
jgi:hypothetical protein